MSAAGGRPLRVAADAEDIGQGLGRLVLAVLELLRQLLERQAIRRADSGSLDEGQVERLGRALMELESKFAELRDAFGCQEQDLDLRLPFDAEQLLAEEPEQRHTTDRRYTR